MTPEELLQTVVSQAMDRMSDSYRDFLSRLARTSGTGLALLVGLQSAYVPKSPKDLWLLCGCWIFLSVATVSGLVALLGESRSHKVFLLRLRDAIAQKVPQWSRLDPASAYREMVDAIRSVHYMRPKKYAAAAAVSFATYAAAILAMTAFAIRNL